MCGCTDIHKECKPRVLFSVLGFGVLSLHGILFLNVAVSITDRQCFCGCLLPCVGRTDVQWFQIWFNGSEPHVVGSAWRLFLVRWRLVNRSSNCMVMVFIGSTACDVAKESQASFCYYFGKLGTPWQCPVFCICYMTSVRDPQNLAESPCVNGIRFLDIVQFTFKHCEHSEHHAIFRNYLSSLRL